MGADENAAVVRRGYEAFNAAPLGRPNAPAGRILSRGH